MATSWTELVLLVGIIGFVLHVWALVDVVRTPSSTWAQADQNQILWLVLVLLLSIIGPLLYLVVARPQLRAARRDGG